MSLTDCFLAFLSLFFLYTGWQKGFLRTILGPVSLIVGSILSYLYYLNTKNLMISLIIGIVGPFLLNIIFSLGLNLENKNVSHRSVSFASHVFGSLLSLIWSGGILILFLILIVMIPLNIPTLDQIQGDIRKSFSYSLVEKILKHRVPAIEHVNETLTTVLNDKNQMEQLRSSQEFNSLMEDEHIRQILQDETTRKEIEDKNFAALVANPKILSLLNDETLMKKILAMQAKMLKEGYPVSTREKPVAENEER